MDEQQQVQQNAEQVQDPTQPVTEQPQEASVEVQPESVQEPVIDASQSVQDVQQAVQDPAQEVTTNDDFISAYNDLCKQKGKQFNYQLVVTPNSDGVFDLTKLSIIRLVVDLPQE